MTEFYTPITEDITEETIIRQFDASLASTIPAAIQHTNETYNELSGTPIRWKEAEFLGITNPPYLTTYLNGDGHAIVLKFPLNPSEMDKEILRNGYGVFVPKRFISVTDELPADGISHMESKLTIPYGSEGVTISRSTFFEDGRSPEIIPSDEALLDSEKGQMIARYVLGKIEKVGPFTNAQQEFAGDKGINIPECSIFTLGSGATLAALSRIGIEQ